MHSSRARHFPANCPIQVPSETPAAINADLAAIDFPSRAMTVTSRAYLAREAARSAPLGTRPLHRNPGSNEAGSLVERLGASIGSEDLGHSCILAHNRPDQCAPYPLAAASAPYDEEREVAVGHVVRTNFHLAPLSLCRAHQSRALPHYLDQHQSCSRHLQQNRRVHGERVSREWRKDVMPETIEPERRIYR